MLDGRPSATVRTAWRSMWSSAARVAVSYPSGRAGAAGTTTGSTAF
ncbi:hypothetical protein AB0M41_41435 [Streptomyces sp. NPDC051896]